MLFFKHIYLFLLIINNNLFLLIYLFLFFTDFDARDFPTEAKGAEECFEYLNCLIKQYENIDTAGKRKFLVQVILLCATHSSIYLWSNKESLSASQGMFCLMPKYM